MNLGHILVSHDINNPIQIQNTEIITDDSMCSICSETLVETERYTSCCNHTFHYNCIHRHMLTPKATCPLCREKITLNTKMEDVKHEKSFLHTFFNIDIGNFYLLTGILYQCIVVPSTFFNISILGVALAGLIKFKFEKFVTIYFAISLVMGTVQSLINMRVRDILDNYYVTHQPIERFGKNEVTALQVIWSILYLGMCIYSIYIINMQDESNIKAIYLDLIIASNICRFTVSILKMFIYVFDIYAVYERMLNAKNLYTFLTIHS